MIAPEHVRTMARYNRWMNERTYECCARLTDAQRKEDMGAFFKSIHGTLNHLLLADRVWMGRFKGQPYHPRSLADELYADFEELRRERGKTDDVIDAWAAYHQAHHRGQLTTLLFQRGIDPGVTDLIALPGALEVA